MTINYGDFDHRHPFPGDSGIQFEIFEDINTLPKGVDRTFFEREGTPEELLHPLFDMLEELRRRGFAQPPLED